MSESPEDEWFRKTYSAHHAQILAYLIRRSSVDPEAAAAEVFLIAWRRRRELDDRDNLLPWLYGTARRVLMNQRRGNARFRKLIGKIGGNGRPEHTSPEVVIVQNDEDRIVLEALDWLSTRDREIIQLSVWEELPRSAVAHILGCSEAAATMRLHRAVHRLQRRLKVRTRESIDRDPTLSLKAEARSD